METRKVRTNFYIKNNSQFKNRRKSNEDGTMGNSINERRVGNVEI